MASFSSVGFAMGPTGTVTKRVHRARSVGRRVHCSVALFSVWFLQFHAKSFATKNDRKLAILSRMLGKNVPCNVNCLKTHLSEPLRRTSSGQLCGRADERRPTDNCSRLQDLIHALWSVQRLSGCQWQGHCCLRTVCGGISLRHCSRCSRYIRTHLPHRSRRIWEK